MNQRELLDIINIIRDKADNGKLVVFVGAGVSRNVEGMPSWHSLVKAMADAIHYSKCDDCKHRDDGCEENCRLREEYSNDEFLKIPQYVYNQDPNLYNQILEDQIKEVSVDAPLSKAIFNINPTHIITTNYDTLLESSTSELREQYQVIVRDKDLLDSTKIKYIIKMHGDLHDKSTIVLKEQDYLNYSQNRVLIELFIKSLLTDHVVLFLGYSLNDYNIKQIISWLNYMRSQNDALEGVKVGYIVFDEDNIDERQQTYFENNSIGIINIHNMPQVENIPTSLKIEEGKRLYSLLKVVENPSLESNFEPQVFIKHFLEFAKQYSFIDYKNLLNLLHIGRYEKTEGELSLFEQKDYDKLKSYLDSSIPEATGIRQRFIDAGIGIISYWNPPHDLLTYKFDEEIQSTLFQDKAFELYLTNNYKELESLISKNAYNSMRACFYHSLSSFYDGAIYTAYDGIDFNSLTRSQKTTFLINKAYLDLFKAHNANYKKVKAFIDNTSRKSERECLSFFADMFDGYSSKKSYIEKQFAELKKYYQGNTVSLGGGTLGHFYKIKNIAIELFDSIFYNNIFIEGVGAEIKEIFSLYIESIICTNGEYSTSESSWFGIKASKEQYQITVIDADIMTKFISTKDLQNLILDYRVKKISLNFEKKYLIDLFTNLINSIDSVLSIARLSFWRALSNYFVLFNLLDFSNDEFAQIEELVCTLLSNKKFISFFFTINYPDFRMCLQPLVSLCKKVIKHNQIGVVKAIIALSTFHDYFINSTSTEVKKLFDTLMIGKENEEVQADLIDIIDKETNNICKNRLIWLFSNSITNEESLKALRCVINSNWQQLSSNMFLDFVFADWIELDKEMVEALLHEVVELDNKRSSTGVYYMPDPLEEKIQELCILVITDKIDNLDCLLPIKNKTPQLEFLLAPDDFDYDRVDVSDYMWGNIMRSKKYLPYFIKAKEKIVPKIQRRITFGSASEFERIILYGFLLDKEELF